MEMVHLNGQSRLAVTAKEKISANPAEPFGVLWSRMLYGSTVAAQSARYVKQALKLP